MNQKEKKIVDYVSGLYDVAKSAIERSEMLEDVPKYRELYEASHDPTELYKTRSKYKLKDAYAQVETFVAQMVDLIFASQPFFVTEPVGKDDEAGGKYILAGALIQKQISVYLAFKYKIELALREMGTVGTVFLQPYWKNNKVKVPGRNQMEFNTGTFGMVAEENTWEYEDQGFPEFDIISVEDCFLDPRSVRMDCSDAEYFIKRVGGKSIEALRRAGVYKNLDEVAKDVEERKQKGFSGTDLGVPIMSDRIMSSDSGTHVENDEVGDSSNIILRQCWTKNKVYTIANGQFLIYEGSHPFGTAPLIKLPYTPTHKKTYARGICWAIYDVQHEKNAHRNQMRDLCTIGLLGRYLKRIGVVSHPRDLNDAWQSQVIEMADISDNAFRPLDPPKVPQLSVAEVEMMSRDEQIFTGISNAVQGMTMKGTQTATEQALLQQNTSVRLKVPNAHVIEAIRLLLNWFHKLNREYLSSKEIVRLTGEDPQRYLLAMGDKEGKSPGSIEVTRTAIECNLDFKILISAEINNKVMRDQKLLQCLELALKLKPIMPNLNLEYLISTIFTELYGMFLDREQLILTPDQTEQYAQMLQMTGGTPNAQQMQRGGTAQHIAQQGAAGKMMGDNLQAGGV